MIEKKINLEQEFFKTFKIEPKKLFSARMGINPDAVMYPFITDDIYFKLIFYISIDYIVKIENCDNIQELRENILKSCIGYITSDKIPNKRKEQLLNQVQKLFIESEQ